MGLQGRLEDLALLDMIQVIAFSQKSGCLRVESPHGKGLVVFRSGRLVFCGSWSTIGDYAAQLQSEDANRETRLKALIMSSMRELTGLAHGSFVFDASDRVDMLFEGVPVAGLLLEHGLDPQHVLLELSRELDEARRDASEKLGGQFDVTEGPDLDDAFATVVEPPASPSPSQGELHQIAGLDVTNITVVLVDDEPAVVSTVGMGLRSDGFSVREATSPSEGKKLVLEALERPNPVVLVTDLKMPTSDGLSFLGGLELVSSLRDVKERVPTLLMVESITSEERQVAIALGLRQVIYKPTLTKPDPQLYARDLDELASGVSGEVELLARAQLEASRTEAIALNESLETSVETDTFGETPEPVAAGGTTSIGASATAVESVVRDTAQVSTVEPASESRLPWTGGVVPAELPSGAATVKQMSPFLVEATRRLKQPADSVEVSVTVLEAAGRYLERGVLLLLRGNHARGVAGFRLRRADNPIEVRQIQIGIKSNDVFRAVVASRAMQRVDADSPSFDEMFSHIGRAQATQAVLIPLVVNGQVLTVLYGDNGVRGGTIGSLKALRSLIQQASFAMQNVLLRDRS